MSINLIGREFVNTDLTIPLATLSLGSPGVLVSGVENEGTEVDSGLYSASLTALNASVNAANRVFPGTAKMSLSASNLLFASENLASGVWSNPPNTVNAVINADTEVDRDGNGASADSMSHGLQSGFSRVGQQQTLSNIKPNTEYDLSVFAKRISDIPGNTSYVVMEVIGAVTHKVFCNLFNGGISAGSQNVYNLQSEEAGEDFSAGNFWYRFKMQFNSGAAQTLTIRFLLAEDRGTGPTDSIDLSQLHEIGIEGMQLNRTGLPGMPPYKFTTDARTSFDTTVVGTPVGGDTNITASTAVMDVRGLTQIIPQNAPAANYPLVTCMFAIGSGSDRRSNEPYRTNLAHGTHVVHQAVGMLDESGRRNRYVEFWGLDLINPFAVHIMHYDFHFIQVEFNGGGPTSWMEDLAYADSSNFNDWITLEGTDESGNPQYLAEGFAYDLAYNWQGPKYIHETVATRTWNDHSNFGDPDTDPKTTANVARDFQLSLMQDTLGWNNSNVRYQRLRFQGEITSVGPGYEVEIPPFPNAASYFSGGTIGDGYTESSEQLQGIILNAARTNGTSDEVIGWKNINASTDKLLLSGSPGFSLSSGDTITVQSGDGGGSTSNRGGSQALYHENTHYLINYYAELQSTNYGLTVGSYCNMGSQNWFIKRILGRDDVPVPDWDLLWDGIHWERADRECGFGWESGETYYRTDTGNRRREYQEDYFPSAIALNRRVLKPEAASHTYPMIWWNVNNVRYRGQGSSTSERDLDSYTWLDRYDAAFVRSHAGFAWSCSNVGVQPEVGGGHDIPIMLDEMLIDAGNPVSPRDVWTGYDPTGDNNKGTITWRTPDFGTRGYIFRFENCILIGNLRKPDSVGPWVPSYLDGVTLPDGLTLTGQPTDSRDIATLPNPGTGNVYRRFNRATYVNTNPDSPFFGQTPSDFDATYILSDPDFNDGSLVGGEGTTVVCGPLEWYFLMIEPA